MSDNDNNTIIDFGRRENSPDRRNETVIEISSSSDGTRFKAESSSDMRTILDMDDNFGLNFSHDEGNVDYHQRFFRDTFHHSIEELPQQESTDSQELDFVDKSNQLPAGTMIAGRYEIHNTLGVGGFSIVYGAYDKKLETEVAVKELFPPSLAFRKTGEERVIINGRKSDFDYLLDRFVLEARTMAKYNSDPNIVNIFDCVLENNTAYIIMEYLDGQNLEDYTQSRPGGKLKLEEAISIIEGVLDGLDRVHKKGIVHRDIKPKNIVLTKKGEVKIIDFGAARFYATEEEVVNNFTKVLTPGFAPPEQYQRDKKQGSFTDVYASAATFYYMLTGEVPEVSVDRKLSDHLKPLSELFPDIPGYVDNAVRRAMVLNSDLRVQNASDFKLALLGKKVLRTTLDEKKTRMRNRLLLLVATIFLFTVGLVGFFVYQAKYAGGRSICADIRSDDTLSVWLPVSESDEKRSKQIEMYTNTIGDYTSYVQEESERSIEVNVKYISESDYSKALATAYKTNSMPDVYDSSSVQFDDANVLDCRGIFRYLSEENYALYSYYENQQIPYRRFAVGFNTYVLYINNKLKSELELDKLDSFDSMVTFSYDETEVYGICCTADLFGLAEDQNIYIGEDAADVFKDGRALCYIGRVSESIGISESLPGYWSVLPMPGKDKISIRLKTWSVYKNTDNKAAAAMALLYYVTGEDKQDYFYLQNRDVLPVNQLVLSSYSKYYPEFSFITDDNRQYTVESSD